MNLRKYDPYETEKALERFLKEKKKKDETIPNIIGFVLGIPIVALFLMWYNHVWIQWPVHYWQWMCFSVGLILIKSKLTEIIFSVIFSVAVLAQIAHWMGFVAFPLIHLK
jgi:hypothetical protein